MNGIFGEGKDMSKKTKSAEKLAAEMVALVKSKKLHDHLECDPQADPFRYGGSAELYYDSVLIMVHPQIDGNIRFSPVAPPDDAHLLPKGTLKGFSAPRDFDTKTVARQVRVLCKEVKKIYSAHGVTAHLYDDEFSIDQSLCIDCKTDRIVGGDYEEEEDDFDPNEGEEWKNGTK
jgi:hypothetical protein